jgi:hypothetical protein
MVPSLPCDACRRIDRETDHYTMSLLYQASKVLSIALFAYYGLAVLVSDAMVEEFQRFGLAGFRKFTGILELIGSLGLILGYFVSPFTVLAAAGLALLMGAGVVVRLRCGDSMRDALPAFIMMLLNLFIALYALRMQLPAR